MPCHTKKVQLFLSCPPLHFYLTSLTNKHSKDQVDRQKEKKHLMKTFPSPTGCLCLPRTKASESMKVSELSGALPSLTPFWEHIWLQSLRKCPLSLNGGSKHHIAWMHSAAPGCAWHRGLGFPSLRSEFLSVGSVGITHHSRAKPDLFFFHMSSEPCCCVSFTDISA